MNWTCWIKHQWQYMLPQDRLCLNCGKHQVDVSNVFYDWFRRWQDA